MDIYLLKVSSWVSSLDIGHSENQCRSFVTFDGDCLGQGTGVDGPDIQDILLSWGRHPLLPLTFECSWDRQLSVALIPLAASIIFNGQSGQSAIEDMLESRPGTCLYFPGECTNPQREGSGFCDEHYWQRETDDGYVERHSITPSE